MAGGCPLPLAERTVTLDIDQRCAVRSRSSLLLLGAAETLSRSFNLPRWAAIASLQPTLASCLHSGANIVDRRLECRAMVAACAPLVAAGRDDHEAIRAALRDIERTHLAYLSGARVQ